MTYPAEDSDIEYSIIVYIHLFYRNGLKNKYLIAIFLAVSESATVVGHARQWMLEFIATRCLARTSHAHQEPPCPSENSITFPYARSTLKPRASSTPTSWGSRRAFVRRLIFP